MAIEICLTVNDDGSMAVSQEEVEAEQGEEMAEAAGTPVKSIDEVLEVIRQMVDQAAMAPPADDEMAAEGGEAPQEEEMMMESFRGMR